MRCAWIAAGVLVLAVASATAALQDDCNKGGIEVPLFTLQAKLGFDNCEPGLKPGPPEEQLAAFADEASIYRCLCYAGFLQGKAIEQNSPRKDHYTAQVAKLANILAYFQRTNASTAPVVCTLSATPSFLAVPGAAQQVHVVGSVPPGTSAVTIESTRSDANGTKTLSPAITPNGRFAATYVFNVDADEGSEGIAFHFVEPDCKKPARVLFRRIAAAASLSAKPNPMLVDPGGQARLTLLLIGTGSAQWTAHADGVQVLGPLVSGHQPKVHMVPFSLPPDTAGAITAQVQFPAGGEITTNAVRVAVKPRAANPPIAKADPFCDAGTTAATVVFRADNPSGLPIEVRGAVKGKAGTSPVVTATGTGNAVAIMFPLPPISPPGAKFRLYLKARYVFDGTKVLFYDNTANPATLTIRKAAGNVVAGALVPRGAAGDACELCDCDLGEPDDDLDGVGNPSDNCPDVANADQADADADGVGNACDNCPDAPNDEQADGDQDGAGDACDTCPDDPNPGGADGDGDGTGDACDVCPGDFDPEQADTDADGLGDVCDNCPETVNADQADDDQDGVGNACADDDACEPATCCAEFPEACGTDCFEPCPPDHEVDPSDCATCNPAADVEPPVVEIQAPGSGSSVPAGATVQVTTLFVDAGPLDTGIVSGTFSASGPAVASGAAPASFEIAATPQRTQLFAFTVKSDLTGITDRNIVVTAQGTDAAGHRSAVATVDLVASGTGLSLLLSVSPSDPGPGEAVTVTITVTNCVSGTTQLHYSVAGTDGYAAAGTLTVDGACQASFGIPGGGTGVVDVVTVDIVGSGITQTVSYSF